ARRDAAWREADGARRVGRYRRRAAGGAAAAGQPREGGDRGHRRRDPAVRHRPGLQSLLHHTRQRDRPRARSRAQDRRGPRRADQLPERAGLQHDGHGRGPADPGGAGPPRGRARLMSESEAVSARDQSAELEEALADNTSLRRHASSVAHDFNNLLAVITGYTEMMLKRLRADDPLRRNAEAIKRATEWGTALAQQILSGSRRTLPAPVPVDLNQLVGNVTRVLQPLLGESIELVTRLRMGTCSMTLVVNAREAMPNGGGLTIETSNVGQAVMRAVGDTGCGMDDETRARLFEPYFTTKEPGRGSGLGLATVYDVVTQ